MNEFVTFWTEHDPSGPGSTLEIQYNPETGEYKEIKTFDSGDVKSTENLFHHLDLTEEQEEAFMAQFPEVEFVA